MVDCSHAQTGKDYSKQPEVLADVVRQVHAGGSPIMGFMLESNLAAGNQPLAGGREGLAYGVSITDGCIDWPTTRTCLSEAATTLGYRAAG
jgi:3-deoxy-7-phosphoheptulonate synthase